MCRPSTIRCCFVFADLTVCRHSNYGRVRRIPVVDGIYFVFLKLCSNFEFIIFINKKAYDVLAWIYDVSYTASVNAKFSKNFADLFLGQLMSQRKRNISGSHCLLKCIKYDFFTTWPWKRRRTGVGHDILLWFW